MDKYELIEVLRAAADGIEKRDSSAAIKNKLDIYKRLCYNLLCSVTKCAASSQFIGIIGKDLIIEYLSQTSNLSGLNPAIKDNVDEAFKAITGGDEPPKDI